jgi:hypothetical protein
MCDMHKPRKSTIEKTIAMVFVSCLILVNTHVMNRLCEYDLIDLQNAHDGDHGFVLVYQDYMTKFTQLRPLKSKSSVELGTTLMDIFCIFGPPLFLQSTADLHVENSAVQQTLEAVWPGRKLSNEIK